MICCRLSLSIFPILMMVACASIGAENGLHYRVAGQVVELEEIRDVFAFQVPEELRSDSLQAVAGNTSAGRMDLPRATERYGIDVYQRPESVSLEAFTAAVSSVRSIVGEETELEVFRNKDVLMILLRTFTVEFHADRAVNAATKLRRFLPADGRFEINRDQSRPDRARFNIQYQNLRAEEVLDLVHELSMRDEIRVAFPVFVRVHPVSVLEFLDKKVGEIAAYTGVDRPCTPAKAGLPPKDPSFKRQWGLHNQYLPISGVCLSNADNGICDADIDWLEVWLGLQILPTLPITTIAVLDVGVQRHVDLRLKTPGIDATVDAGMDPLVDGSWEPIFPEDYHGTAVAGIAAARTDNCIGISGVSPYSQVLPVRIASQGASRYFVEEFEQEAALGVKLAVEQGATVLVNAWWASSDSEDVANELLYAIQDHGAIVVASAGNISVFDCDMTDTGMHQCEDHDLSFPANLVNSPNKCLADGVLAVSASTQRDEFKTVADYVDAPGGVSSVTGTGDWGSRHGAGVSIAAPGTDIVTTTIGDYYTYKPKYFFGTSASAPYAGGAAALLMSMFPAASPYQVKQWIVDTADPGPQTLAVPNEYFGGGRLNLAKAGSMALAQMGLTGSNTMIPAGCEPANP